MESASPSLHNMENPHASSDKPPLTRVGRKNSAWIYVDIPFLKFRVRRARVEPVRLDEFGFSRLVS